MKLTKSEKRLLIILALILTMAAYYYFVFLKQEVTLNGLQDERASLSVQWDDTVQRLKVGKVDQKHLNSVREQIERNSVHYYGELSQSDFLMLINEIAKRAKVKIIDLELDYDKLTIRDYLLDNALQANAEEEASESEAEASNDQLTAEIHQQRAKINCQVSYQTLNNFIDEINNSTKKLNIEELKISSDEQSQLSCHLVVGVYHMPSLDNYIDKNDGVNHFAVAAQQKKETGMFDPYESYVEFKERQRLENAILEGELYVDRIDNGDEMAPEEGAELPLEPPEEVALLFDFSNLNYFFAGNKPEISGSLSLQKNVLSDHKIALLSYRFHDLNDVNQANVAFPEQAVMCERACRKLRLKLYSEQSHRNALRMELIDATAKRAIVDFGAVAADQNWQYVYASLAQDLQFPIMVKRLYIEGEGVQQDLSGELYIDSLAAVVENRQRDSGEDTE